MPGFLRAAVIVLGGSAVLGTAALALLPSAKDLAPAARLSIRGVSVAELPPATCKQQLWPNTDRICQSWTVAKPEVAVALSAPTQVATVVSSAARKIARASDESAPNIDAKGIDQNMIDPSVADPSVADPRLLAVETVQDVRTRVSQAREDKMRASALRSREPHASIAIAARAADGTQRVIMIRPTSRQDHLYYSSRRELAATAFPTLRQ